MQQNEPIKLVRQLPPKELKEDPYAIKVKPKEKILSA